ncbi:hypothetical protein [Streptomyces griseus]|uniref:hypothetical protein n=1 Tax=Streptomyces griseus TaxID=1911 RepID=UPI00056C8AE3|nr:hypothetical protein [Streptomyces griseus]
MEPGNTSGPSQPGGTPESGHVLTPQERAEYERLRRAAGVRHRRLRKAGAAVLLLVTLLLAPLAVVAAWVDEEVADTDRYVQTVEPLASDPDVQDVVIDKLTAQVVANVDVQAVTDSLKKVLSDAGAPPRVVDGVDALTGPLRSAVQAVAQRTITRVVTSDAFQETWVIANRQAHAAVVNMLTGSTEGAVQAKGDTIQLDLGTVIDDVKQRLVDAGFDKASAIPDPDKKITLFRTDKLSEAQDAMRLLDIMGTWLPVLTVALAALAVWTAPGHRVMLLITALGIGVMMVVLLVGLAVVRRIYLDAVPASTLPENAAATIYDTFVRFLRDSTRTLLVVSLITALAAYLYGPGRAARAVRSLSQRGATAAGEAMSGAGLRTGAAGRWLAAHRSWTTGIAIGAGALVLVLWNHPTVGGVALVVGLVLVALAVMAVLAAANPTEGEGAHAPGRAVP